MRKKEFLDKLRAGLILLPEKELEERLAFYREMIEDHIEDGMTEEEAIAEVGNIDDIIAETASAFPEISAVAPEDGASREPEMSKPEIPEPEMPEPFDAAFSDPMTPVHPIYAIPVDAPKKHTGLIAVLVILVMAICLIGAALWILPSQTDARYETKTYTPGNSIGFITIEASIEDITFLRAQDYICRVECDETEQFRHEVTVEGRELKIQTKDSRTWFDRLSISRKTPAIRVYLPRDDYGALSIRCSTGDILVPANFTFSGIGIAATTGDIELRASASGAISLRTSTGDIRVGNVTADSLSVTATTGGLSLDGINCTNNVSVSVSTGDVKIAGLSCRNFAAEGSTGDFELRTLIASESLSINVTTGDVTLYNSDAGKIHIQTTTGSIRGTLQTTKRFEAHSTTGRINVPISGGVSVCQLSTTTGDIDIQVK